ncbi:3-hydroxybutyryl-CoA dehydrogenase [Paenibacillus sp. HB172176]|uniref:3-hydroxybutyryl-CoA dehydrogenase n=1 Tax=Paenibacillus sp. HB172176 TaxID=2493690 RepID=UPI00143C0956|nr:3-hydroxybutyryl-CoA dehydrogenase [Paenibacillus sp. HB172176]
MGIRRLMVAGAGQMGSGIALTAARSGFSIVLYDWSTEQLNHSLEALEKQLAREVEKGRCGADEAREQLSRMTPTDRLEEARSAELVIEAVAENKETKRELFRRLDAICGESTILASNTSSLSITELAAATKRPERVIGMHFMNPVPLMPLVEVIRGAATSDHTFAEILELTRMLGKSPFETKDFPGFVSNRVLMPMINEAIYCVYEGVAVPEAVDAIMRLGMKHPMGPLQLADFIGLDTCLSIMETLYEGFGDSKYRPCPLLRQYVHAGWLGRKSGRGFYSYD